MNMLWMGSSGIGENARIFVDTFKVVQWFTIQVRHSGDIEDSKRHRTKVSHTLDTPPNPVLSFIVMPVVLMTTVPP